MLVIPVFFFMHHTICTSCKVRSIAVASEVPEIRLKRGSSGGTGRLRWTRVVGAEVAEWNGVVDIVRYPKEKKMEA